MQTSLKNKLRIGAAKEELTHRVWHGCYEVLENGSWDCTGSSVCISSSSSLCQLCSRVTKGVIICRCLDTALLQHCQLVLVHEICHTLLPAQNQKHTPLAHLSSCFGTHASIATSRTCFQGEHHETEEQMETILVPEQLRLCVTLLSAS